MLMMAMVVFLGCSEDAPEPEIVDAFEEVSGTQEVSQAVATVNAADSDEAMLKKALWVLLMKPSEIPFDTVSSLALAHQSESVRLWAIRAAFVGAPSVSSAESLLRAVVESDVSPVNRREANAVLALLQDGASQ
jgi:hypothetical protein